MVCNPIYNITNNINITTLYSLSLFKLAKYTPQLSLCIELTAWGITASVGGAGGVGLMQDLILGHFLCTVQTVQSAVYGL